MPAHLSLPVLDVGRRKASFLILQSPSLPFAVQSWSNYWREKRFFAICTPNHEIKTQQAKCLPKQFITNPSHLGRGKIGDRKEMGNKSKESF